MSADLARIAAARVDAARRALEAAKADPQVPTMRIAFLRSELNRAERAAADLDGLTIPPAPARGGAR